MFFFLSWERGGGYTTYVDRFHVSVSKIRLLINFIEEQNMRLGLLGLMCSPSIYQA